VIALDGAHCAGQPEKALAFELPSVEAMAEFIQASLKMLAAQAVQSAEDDGFGIGCCGMRPF
jgi:hypothetical protein